MKQQNTGKSRRGAVCGLLLLLLLLLAAAAAVLPAARGTGEKTTLSVALYPFVPDQARFQQAVEAEWNARHPEVALRFVLWNGYTEDPPDDLDVFVYDSVFLYDFLEKGCLLPIADEEVRDAGDYFPYALDACRVDGVIYALPQLLCTNLLYAREGDSELSEAANVGELYEIVGSSTRTDGPPAEGEGLLVNIPEGMNAAFWYLEVRIDREQQFSEWISFPETDDFDPEVMDVLRTVQEMARGYQKEDFPPEAGWQSYEASFTEGYGRAFIGFSESMYGMGDAADDVVFHRFSLSDGDDIPVTYADIASVNAGIGAEKRELAVELLNILTGRETLVAASSASQEDPVPQYLLIARESVYDELAEEYPVYGKLKAIASDPDCRVFVVCPSGREVIEQAARIFRMPAPAGQAA